MNGNYTQSQLPSDVFNQGDGGITNWNGHAVKVNNAGNGTRNITDLGDYNTYQQQQAATNAANQATANYNNLVTKNTQDVTDFLTKYHGDVSNAVDTANTKFNVPGQADLVNGLNTRIADLSTNMSNSGAGGFANASQVDNAINSRYLPQLNTATTNLNNSANLAQNYTNQLLAPDVANETLLQNNITTSMAGLTATQSAVLNTVLGQLNAGVSVENTQLQAAEQIAQTVLNNANALQQQKNSLAYTPISQNEYLINPSTGQIYNPGILAASGVYNP